MASTPERSDATPLKVLLLGAGELGFAIAQAFSSYCRDSNVADTPITLTILRSVRTSSRKTAPDSVAIALSDGKVQVLFRDVASASQEDLTKLFSGFDTIIGGSGYNSALGIQIKLARSFLASNATTYLPWQYGIDYDTIGYGSALELFDEQLAVRELLRREIGGRRWAILSVGMFMSFIVVPDFGVITRPGRQIDAFRVRALGSKDTKVTVTCVEDIGKAVVHVVAVDSTINGVVFVAGDTLSYGEIAAALGTATQSRVVEEPWTLDQLKKDLASKVDQDKGVEAIMEKYRVAFGTGIGASWPVEDTLNYRAGIQMTNFVDWLKRTWVPSLH